jgi:hypothetical protein
MTDALTPTTLPTVNDQESLLEEATDVDNSITEYCGMAAELDDMALIARENGRDHEGEELPYAEDRVRLAPAHREIKRVISTLRNGIVDAETLARLQETISEWQDTLEDCTTLPPNVT